MNLFGKDMVIGDFRLSDYGLMLASFDTSGSDEEELGMNYDTVEEFIGVSPVPVYIDAKYSNKLTPTATIIKNPCNNEKYFTEHECREILRQLTGFRGYKKMYLLLDEIDDYYYFNVRVTNVSYQKIGGNVAGIILSMECDSQFAWSKDYHLVYDMIPDKQYTFVNISDDIYNYLLPKVTLKAKSDIEKLVFKNISDNNWTTEIKNISSGEIITMDSSCEILSSSIPDKLILNDFNLHFIRMINGRNDFTTNAEITLTLDFNYPRKVGFL